MVSALDNEEGRYTQLTKVICPAASCIPSHNHVTAESEYKFHQELSLVFLGELQPALSQTYVPALIIPQAVRKTVAAPFCSEATARFVNTGCIRVQCGLSSMFLKTS